jgi:hypothetical protein
MSWWTAFALTQVLEVPIWLAGLRGTPLGPGWRLAVAFGASALTHPILFLAQPAAVSVLGDAGYFGVGEAVVTAVEAAYVRSFGLGWGPAVGWSVVANGTSALIGAVLVDFVL